MTIFFIALAVFILIAAGALAFPILISLAVSIAIYTIALTVFEHNGWKTYIFKGASGVALVVILTFIFFLIV